MKVVVILIVAMVLMMTQEADSWRRWRDAINRVPGVPAVKSGVRKVARWVYRGFGKRGGSDAEFNAHYNEAAKDGVFTDEEIKFVFGVDEKGLADFKNLYDVDDDKVVQVAEYETVSTIAANVQ